MKANITGLPKRVHAISGKFIVIDGEIHKLSYSYKDIPHFDLTWDVDGESSLIYWDNTGTHVQQIKNTKTDFNKWVKPLVKLVKDQVH